MAYGRMILTLACICLAFIDCGAARTLTDDEIRSKLKILNKPAVKTMKSSSGSIIDCVDIYKQPAFDHPLLKNHTIQMRPSYYSGENFNSSWSVRQSWHKSGSCPEGTIPILRVQKSDLLRMKTFEEKEVSGTYDHVQIRMKSDYDYHGGFATVNVWNVHVEPNEFSASGMFISTVKKPDLISTGSMVYPVLYGDSRPRLFTNWVTENAGCYDLRCPGFVQTSNKWTLGEELTPTSIFDGTQYIINITVRKDLNTDHWWFEVYDTPVGYWPGSLFKIMVSAADVVAWGGQVFNTAPGGRHTSTEMGSGHFPNEGFKRAAFIANAYLFDYVGAPMLPYPASALVTHRGCYDLHGKGRNKQGIGLDIFFGGPGGPDCDK